MWDRTRATSSTGISHKPHSDRPSRGDWYCTCGRVVTTALRRAPQPGLRRKLKGRDVHALVAGCALRRSRIRMPPAMRWHSCAAWRAPSRERAFEFAPGCALGCAPRLRGDGSKTIAGRQVDRSTSSGLDANWETAELDATRSRCRADATLTLGGLEALTLSEYASHERRAR